MLLQDFYYNDSALWVRLGAGTTNGDWSNTGNSGTIAGTNFLGTTNGVDVVLATNGSENMRLINGGQVTVNTSTPFSVDLFTVRASGNDYAINVYGSGIGSGVYGENLSPVSNGPGVIGSSANGYGLYGVSILGAGAVGWARSTTATGIIGVGNGGNTAIGLTSGSEVSGVGTNYGVVGFSTESTWNSNNRIGSAGGYFTNDHGGYGAVGAWFDENGGGPNAQNFKVVGTGAVSTIVKDVNENNVIMYAPESPECLFLDYGIGELINGQAVIKLDPNLSKNILINEDHPLKVFIQLEGDSNGVFVKNKSTKGFTVKELQGGRSNIPFSWLIVATRADEVFYNERGEARVSVNSRRFPFAPTPLKITTNEAQQFVSKKNANMSEKNSSKKYYKKLKIK